MNLKHFVRLACPAVVMFQLALNPLVATAQAADPQPCHVKKSMQVDFTDAKENDTLSVEVKGSPCSLASLTILLERADGSEVYRYEGNFIEHMPYLIYEPELNTLVDFFAEKVLSGAIQRHTNDLPVYTGVDDFYENTNDFVIIDIKDYEGLRARNLPLLWHATGESTWVHVVYDPGVHLSQVIMRGGVFQ